MTTDTAGLLREALLRMTNAAEMLSVHAKHPDDAAHRSWFPAAIGDIDREVGLSRRALAAEPMPDAAALWSANVMCVHETIGCLDCLTPLRDTSTGVADGAGLDAERNIGQLVGAITALPVPGRRGDPFYKGYERAIRDVLRLPALRVRFAATPAPQEADHAG